MHIATIATRTSSKAVNRGVKQDVLLSVFNTYLVRYASPERLGSPRDRERLTKLRVSLTTPGANLSSPQPLGLALISL